MKNEESARQKRNCEENNRPTQDQIVLSWILEAVGEADWARLAENRVGLSPLTWAEANQLILQRMNAIEPLRQLRQTDLPFYFQDKGVDAFLFRQR